VGKERCFCGVGWLNASTPTRQSLSLILGGMNGDLFCGHNLLCQEIIVACAKVSQGVGTNVTFCGHYLMPGKSIMLAQKVTLRDCFILVVYYGAVLFRPRFSMVAWRSIYILFVVQLLLLISQSR